METELTNPITEHAAQMAAVPDEAADIASKLVEQIVSGHLDAALEAVERGDGAFEDYSPHPISIEGDARAIVAAVTPTLTDRLCANLVQTAVELHQFWQFAILKEGEGPGWDPVVTAREEGKFRGAAWSLQGVLVALGQADEEDDEAGAAYEAIEARLAELKTGGVL